jgi:hypothetical protein
MRIIYAPLVGNLVAEYEDARHRSACGRRCARLLPRGAVSLSRLAA